PGREGIRDRRPAAGKRRRQGKQAPAGTGRRTLSRGFPLSLTALFVPSLHPWRQGRNLFGVEAQLHPVRVAFAWHQARGRERGLVRRIRKALRLQAQAITLAV